MTVVQPVDHRLILLINREIAEDELFRRRDLFEDAAHRIVRPVRAAHHNLERAANAKIDVANRIGETPGPPPLGEMFRIGPGPPDERARRLEAAGDGEFAPVRVDPRQMRGKAIEISLEAGRADGFLT